jgi:hypothetical protein
MTSGDHKRDFINPSMLNLLHPTNNSYPPSSLVISINN